jgi:mannose-6-phosphate isomerase-like protein (cupin superfamily)
MEQTLIADEFAKEIGVQFRRLALTAGASFRFVSSPRSLTWFHVLEGEGSLQTFFTDKLSDRHSVFLPPAFDGTLSTAKGVSILFAEVADPERLDPKLAAERALFTVSDWTREPVLMTKNDRRRRIPLVTPESNHTTAVKVQMVLYPAGATAGTCYRHEGAASFIRVMAGRGTAWTNDHPVSIQAGDLLYFPDGERHRLEAGASDPLRYLIFYAPGVFSTVWDDRTKASAWIATDRDIDDLETARDERERKVYAKVFGNPFTR